MLFLPFILNHLGQLTQVTDAAGIRTTSRNNATVTDTFGYNTRSELTSAQVNNAAYAYDYDNIGNRAAAVADSSGAASRTDYLTNNLNQYTMLSEDDLTDFIPEHERIATQKLELEWDFCRCGRKYELKLNDKISQKSHQMYLFLFDMQKKSNEGMFSPHCAGVLSEFELAEDIDFESCLSNITYRNSAGLRKFYYDIMWHTTIYQLEGHQERDVFIQTMLEDSLMRSIKETEPCVFDD